MTRLLEADASNIGFTSEKQCFYAQHRGGDVIMDVAIRFDSRIAHFIRERRWHVSQRLEENPDGSLILHIKTSGLNEVRHWVLQYGAGAEVLAPESLCEECMEEIMAMLEVYKQ